MAEAKPQKFIIGGLMYVLLFAGAKEEIGGKDSDNKCGGEERWEEKVLIDPDAKKINETSELTTIKDLLTINTTSPDSKYKEGRPRMSIEDKTYTVKHCFITDVLRENDNDLHIVIEDGKGNHMIAEIPDPKCPDAKRSDWSENFNQARNTLLEFSSNYRHFLFTIKGVLFVDKSHGQTGKADNNVELHPVIELIKEKQINPVKK
jgi:hypothetical protein